MPNYRRAHQPGGTFFITVVTFQRFPLFNDPIARSILHNSIAQTREERPFELYAIVLLPDHFHVILELPVGDSDFSTRIAAMKGRFSRRWLECGGREGHQSVTRESQEVRGIWQKRFWEHCVRDDDDLIRCTEYLMYNPVKHGLAKCPHEWPHSSFQRFVSLNRFAGDWQCTCGAPPPPFHIEIAGSEMD